MKLLKLKPGEHQCLLFSVAMVLDEDPYVLQKELGHDGMAKKWDLSVPHCYVGYHIQEIIDLCTKRRHQLMPIEYMPVSAPVGASDYHTIWPADYCKKRFKSYIEYRKAILIGPTHACAWDGKKVFDPKKIY